jgi:transposase
MVKRWFERCSPTSAANLGSVQWSRRPLPEEDRRHLCRERKALTAERVRHVNRIKGFLFSQGVSGYQPLRRDRRQRLEELQTGFDNDTGGHVFPERDQ